MKKFFVLSALGLLLIPVSLQAQEMQATTQATDGGYDQIAQEAQRNRELLQIWKDHVRTLTEERNAAYKEIEGLKSGLSQTNSPARQFAPMEIQPVAFQAQFEAKPSASYRDLMSRYEAQKKQLAELKGETETYRSENERLNNELKAAIERGVISQSSSPDVEELARQREDAQRQVREMSYQNEALRAKNEKLNLIEKELEDTRAYLTPFIEKLEEKNRTLQAQVGALEDANQGFLSEKMSLGESITHLNQTVSANEEKLKISFSSREELQRQADNLSKERDQFRLRVQELTDEQEKSKALDAELEATKQELSILKQSHADLKQSNGELKNLQAQQAKTIEDLKANLHTNLSDIQNLKTNLESYLESLVSNFEEKQR